MGESLSSRSTLFFWVFLVFWEMFNLERVSYAERNFKIVIFKRVLRLNMNEINRWRLSFLLEAISILCDKSYKISWCNYVSLSCFGQMSLGMEVIGGERAPALNAPMRTSQFHSWLNTP
jgi:hypothetical protein